MMRLSTSGAGWLGAQLGTTNTVDFSHLQHRLALFPHRSLNRFVCNKVDRNSVPVLGRSGVPPSPFAVLRFVGIKPMLTDADRQQLDQQGYLVLPGLMSAELLESLRSRVEELFREEGDRAGSEFKQEPGARRLANLVNKGPVFEDVILTPSVLEAMGHVLGPRFKLSSLNVRSADPHSDSDQPLHADSGAVADERGFWVANSVWMLDDFTPENGATRMVPGSHRWGQAPPPGMYEPHPQQQLVTGKAGTVVVR